MTGWKDGQINQASQGGGKLPAIELNYFKDAENGTVAQGRLFPPP